MIEVEPTIERTRHAMILAAGRGSRLDPEEGYKLLIDLGGQTLFERHLIGFSRLGVDRVTVVTGYRNEELERRIGEVEPPDGVEVETAVNPAFDGDNGLSVIAGVDQARRDFEPAVPFWLTMSDHLFELSLFENLRERLEVGGEAPGGFLVVDRRRNHVRDVDDATKIRFADGSFDAIGKQLDGFDVIDCGLFWCDEDFVAALDDERQRSGDCSTSHAVRRLAEDGNFSFVDIGDVRWEDVDTEEDRSRAERIASDQ